MYHRDNELILHSDNEIKIQLFHILIKKLLHAYNNDSIIDEFLIRTVYMQIMRKKQDMTYMTIQSDIADDEYNPIIVPQGRSIFPRTDNQNNFLQALYTYNIVFGLGPAGTGKTFLAIAYALEQLLSHKIDKIILSRPVLEAGENLGFLPGDIAQKLTPYVVPLYDAMEYITSYAVIQKLLESKRIELVPLAYMRGYSFRNSIIILDEAQNSSYGQMKLFLTRIGVNAQMIIIGDLSQSDLKKQSGLQSAVAIVHDIHAIAVHYFNTSDIVRSDLARNIVHAYEKHESMHQS